MPDPSAVLRDMSCLDWLGQPPNAGTRARPGRMDPESGILYVADVADSIEASITPEWDAYTVDMALAGAGDLQTVSIEVTRDTLLVDLLCGIQAAGGSVVDLNYLYVFANIIQEPGVTDVTKRCRLFAWNNGGQSLGLPFLGGTFADWIGRILVETTYVERLPIFLPKRSHVYMTATSTAGGAALDLRMNVRGWGRVATGQPLNLWR